MGLKFNSLHRNQVQAVMQKPKNGGIKMKGKLGMQHKKEKHMNEKARHNNMVILKLHDLKMNQKIAILITRNAKSLIIRTRIVVSK